MTTIQKIVGSEILDSRGNPTVRVKVILSDGSIGVASVPSGASTGSHEALELRDHNPKRYAGHGVLSAVVHINGSIAEVLKKKNILAQRDIDETMKTLDGTENKSRLGANALLGVSLACAHAGAASQRLPLYRYLRSLYDLKYPEYTLPYPMMNIENGGAHAGWILDFQEYMIVPKQKIFRERVRAGSEIFHMLGSVLKDNGYSTLVGDEGGYAVPFKKNEDAVRMIMKAIKKAGYSAGGDVFLAIDPATSELYDKKMKKYVLKRDAKKLSSDRMIALWNTWLKKYPILSIEDGLAEDDWNGWKEMTRAFGKRCMLVGDDLFVTNTARLQQGIDMRAANAILIKLNQIGTLTETVDCITLAQRAGYTIVISHRSGETADTTIADLSVAVHAPYIKTGSLSRSERIEKYNRLMEIESEL